MKMTQVLQTIRPAARFSRTFLILKMTLWRTKKRETQVKINRVSYLAQLRKTWMPYANTAKIRAIVEAFLPRATIRLV
jgi:hypothetical protein